MRDMRVAAARLVTSIMMMMGGKEKLYDRESCLFPWERKVRLQDVLHNQALTLIPLIKR